MEDHYKPPSILRLQGVTFKDYTSIEDVADDKLLENEPEDLGIDSVYDRIPRVFNSLENWPYHSNLCCWQCGFTFDDRPKFVPTHVRESDSGGIEFGVLGNMCTFNCAARWIMINYAAKDDQCWRAHDNLCLLYFMFTGRRVANIKPAPDKTELHKYGGDLDEEAFWKKMRALDPVGGLRDHTFNSTIPERLRPQLIPERDRVKTALSNIKSKTTAEALQQPRVASVRSVWNLCGTAVVTPNVEDSVAFMEDDAASVARPREDNVVLADADTDILNALLELQGDDTDLDAVATDGAMATEDGAMATDDDLLGAAIETALHCADDVYDSEDLLDEFTIVEGPPLPTSVVDDLDDLLGTAVDDDAALDELIFGEKPEPVAEPVAEPMAEPVAEPIAESAPQLSDGDMDELLGELY